MYSLSFHLPKRKGKWKIAKVSIRKKNKKIFKCYIILFSSESRLKYEKATDAYIFPPIPFFPLVVISSFFFFPFTKVLSSFSF